MLQDRLPVRKNGSRSATELLTRIEEETHKHMLMCKLTIFFLVKRPSPMMKDETGRAQAEELTDDLLTLLCHTQQYATHIHS